MLYDKINSLLEHSSSFTDIIQSKNDAATKRLPVVSPTSCFTNGHFAYESHIDVSLINHFTIDCNKVSQTPTLVVPFVS